MRKIPVALLETFSLFYKHQNICLVAKNTDQTQANVSFQLKKLEELVEIQLFQTIGRKKSFTVKGSQLAEALAGKFEQIQDVTQRFLDDELPEELRLFRISCRPELLTQVLKHIRVPERCKFILSSTEKSLKSLEDGSTDVAIVSTPIDSHDFIAKQIVEMTATLAVNCSLKEKFLNLPRKKSSWKKFFTTHPCVLYHLDLAYFNEFLNYLEISKKELNIRYFCEEWNSIVHFVDTYPVWSLLPSCFLTEQSPKVCEVGLDRNFPIRLFAVYHHKNKNFSWIKSIPKYKPLISP